MSHPPDHSNTPKAPKRAHTNADPSAPTTDNDKRYLVLLGTNGQPPKGDILGGADSKHIASKTDAPTFGEQKEAVERVGEIFRLENRIHMLSLLIAQAEYMVGIRKVVRNEVMRYFWESEVGRSQFWSQTRMKRWFDAVAVEDDERRIALDREYLNELRARLERL